MEELKIDRSRLKTVRNFANQQGLSVQQIYNWMKDGKVKHTKIDGIKFIVL